MQPILETSFLEKVTPELKRVNTLITQSLRSDEPLVELIGKHLINAGGKRLRPILLIMSANALGYRGNEHIELAAVIEFIHSATLLHDDVVDVSALRRGLPTANSQWGNAPSVLVGDFLYSRAFQMMVALGSMDIMRIMANTTNIIAEGEVQQLANIRNSNVDEKDYLDVIYKKTAALFEAACECGASIAGASEAQRDILRRSGHHIGLAFQLMDDVLDYDGNESTIGKTIGDDLAEGKATLPIIHALNHANASDAELIKHSIESADASNIGAIISVIKAHGSLDYTRNVAYEHADAAVKILSALPHTDWRHSLIELCEFSTSRTY